jgi:hypothetical protein
MKLYDFTGGQAVDKIIDLGRLMHLLTSAKPIPKICTDSELFSRNDTGVR